MRTNEAPEKIYIACDVVTEEGRAFILEHPVSGLRSIEYTRTDAFIKKACDAYCKVCKMPNCRSNECKWISDLKGHLETI